MPKLKPWHFVLVYLIIIILLPIMIPLAIIYGILYGIARGAIVVIDTTCDVIENIVGP